MYYGLLRHSPHKWPDLVKFVGALLTDKYEVVKIKYFTARVAKNDDDPDMAIKQQQYLEALKSLEKVEVIEGVYKRFRVKLPFAKEPCRSCDKVQYATVVKTEEKMSDVNLASGSKASGCNGEDGIRGLHGFSGRCIKNMRLLCKAWYIKFR